LDPDLYFKMSVDTSPDLTEMLKICSNFNKTLLLNENKDKFLNFYINFIALGTSYLCFTFIFFSFQLLDPDPYSKRRFESTCHSSAYPDPMHIRSSSSADQIQIQFWSALDPMLIRSGSNKDQIRFQVQNSCSERAKFTCSWYNCLRIFLTLYLHSGDVREWEKTAHPSKLKNCCKFGTP
jgi:hypothetical protein